VVIGPERVAEIPIGRAKKIFEKDSDLKVIIEFDPLNKRAREIMKEIKKYEAHAVISGFDLLAIEIRPKTERSI